MLYDCGDIIAGSGRAHAATLGVATHIAFTMWVAPGKSTPSPYFYLKIAAINMTLSVIDTAVGPIDLSFSQALISFLTPIVVQSVDTLIENGFPIPLSKGFTLSNPSIAFFPQYFAIEADFQLNPSAQAFAEEWMDMDHA